MPNVDEELAFNRRVTDVNYNALSTRVTILEQIVNNQVLPELGHNTAMTADTNAKMDEMYAGFLLAKNGVRMVSAMGNGVMKVAKVVERIGRPLIYLIIISGATWTGLKVPEWLANLLKFL